MHAHHDHNNVLVVLSVVIAIVASYVALDFASSLSTSKRNIKRFLLIGGSLAMGIGIWSMHFVGMLALNTPSIEVAYDIPLMILSIIVAIAASMLVLYLVSKGRVSLWIIILGSFIMGGAIAGMHYIGIASMRMAAVIHWNYFWVFISILIAIVASFVSLVFSIKLREDSSKRGILNRIIAGTIMGIAISGMHYTGMFAMHIVPISYSPITSSELLATPGLTFAVILSTVIILGLAIWGTAVERAFTRNVLMNEVLEDAIRSRDNFLSIASHELKTPLTSIKLQTQIMMREVAKVQSENEVEIKKINRLLLQTDQSIERLTRLVDDMLDISRLSTNKMMLQLEEFNLTDMVEDIVERLRPHLNEFQSSVLIKKEASIVGRWDKFRMEQVVANLLTNAARYGNGKPIEVKVTHSKGLARIHVKDQGRGIAKEDQERIFHRFERAISNNEISGLGLGLFIVKEILEMHKGSISVKSEPNIGSEFIVSLPLHTFLRDS